MIKVSFADVKVMETIGEAELYILEHVSHRRTLDMLITDETGKAVYRIKDKYGLFSKTAYIRDRKGNILAKVSQLPGITPVSRVMCGNGSVFKVSQLFSLRPKFTVKGSDYKINGYIFDTDYSIIKQERAVLRCKKRKDTGSTYFEIEVSDRHYEIEGIAIVVAIEAAKRNLFMGQR